MEIHIEGIKRLSVDAKSHEMEIGEYLLHIHHHYHVSGGAKAFHAAKNGIVFKLTQQEDDFGFFLIPPSCPEWNTMWTTLKKSIENITIFENVKYVGTQKIKDEWLHTFKEVRSDDKDVEKPCYRFFYIDLSENFKIKA